MAATPTLLDHGVDVTSDPADSASVSPAAGSVLFLFVGYSVVGGTVAGVNHDFTVSGVATTWTELAHAHPSIANRRGLFLYRGVGPFTPGTIGMDFTTGHGATWETTFWSLTEITNPDTGDPEDAPVTTVDNNSVTSGAIADVGTVGADDIVLAGFTHESNEAVTITGFTSLSHDANATGLRTLTVGWHATDDTPAATWASGSSYTAIGVIVNGVSGGASAALTGTATAGIDEADIVAGGKTIVMTLTGDTFIDN
jgi:hypothetical protein